MRLSLQIDQQFRDHLKRTWLRAVVRKALSVTGADLTIQLELVITDDETLHKLNREYRHIDRPTDVLAFALTEESGGINFLMPPDELPHLGQVIVSYPTAVKQAAEHGHPVEREVALLVTHGVLHLLGYYHETEEQKREMRALEEKVLSAIIASE